MMMTNETMEILESKLREWQRTREDYFAQIQEELHGLRLSLRSRNRKEENPEDQALNDKELVETEVATEPVEIEQGAVRNEANAMMILAIDKEGPISQLQVPVSKLEPSLRFRNASPDVCEDFKSLVGFDGLCDHVKARNELVTKSTSVTNNQVAHQLFDEIPLRKRILPKERRKRFHKCWRFKFKDTAQPRGLIQEKLCVQEANETMNQLMLPMDLGRHILHQQLEINLCEYKNQSLQLSNHDLETQMLPCLQRFSVVRMGIHVVFCLQELKPIWWVGYNEAVGVTSTNQELSYWSVANNVKRDAHESFGNNLIVASISKLRVRKHDNLIWKEDVSDESRSRPSRCIVKLGDATITCNNLLEKSYDKNLDTVAWRNRPGRSEISNEKESRPEVMDMNQTLLYHQIGHGVDILLVPKLLVHDKEGAVLPQRSKSLKISDCSDRSSRANRVWKPGGLLCVPNKKFEAELEICYKRDRVLKCYFLSEIPFVEFIEFKACKKELSVAGLRQRSLASMTFELRNVEDGVKQDTNRFSGDVGAKILMAFEGLHLLQVMRNTKLKFAKQWMFKFRKKKIDQQLGCDLMVTYLDNQTTWTSRFDEEDQRNLQARTANSLSRREISTFICQAEALLFESKEPAISANQKHSSSSLRANQIWDPGGKFLYI